MDRYTILCTEEQTKKAFELGAPLLTWGFAREPIIPTAEQMIGWLEEQDGIEDIVVGIYLLEYWEFAISGKDDAFISHGGFYNRKEATLAAIDAALDYLMEKKGGTK